MHSSKIKYKKKKVQIDLKVRAIFGRAVPNQPNTAGRSLSISSAAPNGSPDKKLINIARSMYSFQLNGTQKD
jgi:hypothetical protein